MAKRTAIITGGASGMGLATAKKLRENGIDVVIFDMQEPPEGFRFFRVDIRDDAQIKEALAEIARVDILINNAGVYFEKYLEDTTNEEIDRMVDTNIKGSYLMTRNAFPKILESQGTVLFIASCLGMVPELTSPLYCTTKAGLVMLTKYLAQEYAGRGVRVNCILPGPIDTPLLQASFSSPEAEAACAARIPLKRIGKPEDIANMAAFLVSEEAGYITGGMFAVDGGVSSSSMYSRR